MVLNTLVISGSYPCSLLVFQTLAVSVSVPPPLCNYITLMTLHITSLNTLHIVTSPKVDQKSSLGKKLPKLISHPFSPLGLTRYASRVFLEQSLAGRACYCHQSHYPWKKKCWHHWHIVMHLKQGAHASSKASLVLMCKVENVYRKIACLSYLPNKQTKWWSCSEDQRLLWKRYLLYHTQASPSHRW